MTSLTGLGRRHGPTAARAAGLLLAAACVMLAGCKTTGKEMAAEETEWIDPFAPKTFKEAEAELPPLPKDADLIVFSVPSTGALQFAVDGKSVTVGQDNVVRYTVVISSQSGARNVTYEGIRCDVFERKLYATLPQGATEWVPNRSESNSVWHRMDTGLRNSYSATLALDYFCDGRTVAGKPAKMLELMRYHAPSKTRW